MWSLQNRKYVILTGDSCLNTSRSIVIVKISMRLHTEMIALSTSNASKTRSKLTYTKRFISYVAEKTVWFH